MEKLIINFEEFELPFVTQSYENTEDLEEELDAADTKSFMESILPKEAIYIGSVESDVNNWSIEDEYYIIALKNKKYDWALFRISWDDNWGNWNFSFDARLKGYQTNYKEAVKYILPKLWESWHIDLKEEQNCEYVYLLNKIEAYRA